jgi:transcriptional regulator GlxA family with amidase domain
MLYVSARHAAALVGDAVIERAAFADPAPNDPELADVVRRAFRVALGAGTRLEREAALADALCRVVARHGARGPAPRTGREPDAVARVRAYLREHVGADVSLGDLAALTGLHPAYLNRVFSAAVGLPPHAYHTHLRVERARELLAAGEPPSAVAWATGFADQSHLTRHFRRAIGVPPGRYRTLLGLGRLTRSRGAAERA